MARLVDVDELVEPDGIGQGEVEEGEDQGDGRQDREAQPHQEQQQRKAVPVRIGGEVGDCSEIKMPFSCQGEGMLMHPEHVHTPDHHRVGASSEGSSNRTHSSWKPMVSVMSRRSSQRLRVGSKTRCRSWYRNSGVILWSGGRVVGGAHRITALTSVSI